MWTHVWWLYVFLELYVKEVKALYDSIIFHYNTQEAKRDDGVDTGGIVLAWW